MSTSFSAKRLSKELAKVDSKPSSISQIHILIFSFQIHKSLPAGITLVKADDFETWLLDIKVLDENPIYQNQTYRLLFRFNEKYPIGKPIPPSLSLLSYQTFHLTTVPRTPRSNLHLSPRPPHPHPPTHLLQWHNLPRPARHTGLDTHLERREHMPVSAEHVNDKYQERATGRRCAVCGQ